MAELAFEYLLAVLEATKGTPVNPPTYYLNMAGTIKPAQNVARPDESRGTLAAYHRSQVVKQWSEWNAQGPLDIYTVNLLAQMGVKGGVTPTTPGGTAPRLWTYTPTMTADDLKAATLYWGDPNVQAWQTAYNMVDSIKIMADAAAGGLVTLQASGRGRFPAKTAPASLPTMTIAPLLSATEMELWIDPTSAIGTTAITGRVLAAEVTINSGVTYKWLAAGTTGGQTFQSHGRKKRWAELKLRLELPDMTQYDQWAAHTSLKTRLKINGAVIETSYRHYVQFDIYGPFTALDWGELEGSNRVVELTILSEYASSPATDFSLVLQNDKAAI